jgi:MATE family multidrug resistance protein
MITLPNKLGTLAEHRLIFALAIPMILSNITTPLLGMLDTAVIGHMSEVHYLAGASIGGLIVTQLYWICGFLRMSITGLSAQSLGAKDNKSSYRSLTQSLVIAGVLGVSFVFLRDVILSLGLHFASAQGEVTQVIDAYFSVRIWGAPAALSSLVLIGWLIGQQKVKAVLFIQIIGNSLNGALDILFVFVFDWGVEGVAAASVIAEYVMFFAATAVVSRYAIRVPIQLLWFNFSALKGIMQLNTAMLVRNIALQLCFAFMTFQGVRLGNEFAAINAILMQFFVLTALGLDGIAHAAEALVGEAKGQGHHGDIVRKTQQSLFWSLMIAGMYSVGFALFGINVIHLLTSIEVLRVAATDYLLLMILLPLICHWCFLLDGVFIGLMRAKAMQNSMLLCSALVFLPSWYLMQALGNKGLWYALMIFMLARGVSLGGYFYYLVQKQRLCAQSFSQSG